MKNEKTLRKWQAEGLNKLEEVYKTRKVFTAVAAPGAGKTFFALSAYKKLREENSELKFLYLVPTRALKEQTNSEFSTSGLDVEEKLYTSLNPTQDGTAATYAQVQASKASVLEFLKKNEVFLVLDEAHHLGVSGKWAKTVEELAEYCKKVLVLTGTPWTSSGNRLPFVRYREVDGEFVVDGDVYYTKKEGVKDGVLRKVHFQGVELETVTKNNGSVVDYSNFSVDRLREAAKADGKWESFEDPRDKQLKWLSRQEVVYSKVLKDTLDHFENDFSGTKKLGGKVLVVCTDSSHAVDVFNWVVANTTLGVVVVTSKSECNFARKAKVGEEVEGVQQVGGSVNSVLKEYVTSTSESNDYQVVVSVKGVSEGVDVPAFTHLAFLTNVKTSLFWLQTVGRVERNKEFGEQRNRVDGATVFHLQTDRLNTLARDFYKRLDVGLEPDQSAPAESGTTSVDSEGRNGEPSEETAKHATFSEERVCRTGFDGERVEEEIANFLPAAETELRLAGVTTPTKEVLYAYAAQLAELEKKARLEKEERLLNFLKNVENKTN